MRKPNHGRLLFITKVVMGGMKCCKCFRGNELYFWGGIL